MMDEEGAVGKPSHDHNAAGEGNVEQKHPPLFFAGQFAQQGNKKVTAH